MSQPRLTTPCSNYPEPRSCGTPRSPWKGKEAGSFLSPPGNTQEVQLPCRAGFALAADLPWQASSEAAGAAGWQGGAASSGKGTVPVCHSPRRPRGPLLLLEESQGCLRGSLEQWGRRKEGQRGRKGSGWGARCGAACVHRCLCSL